MSHTPSVPKPNTTGGRGHGGKYHRQRPSPPRSPPRRRATHEPSALHSYIVASKLKSDYCKARRNTLAFRPERDEFDCYDADTAASGGPGDMDTSSLVSLTTNDISYGDRHLASSLFQVASGASNVADRDGGGLKHWQAAASVAVSFDAAETVPRDNRSRHLRGGVASLDELDVGRHCATSSGFLPGFFPPSPPPRDDDESSSFVVGGCEEGSVEPSVDTSGSDGSSLLWDHIESRRGLQNHSSSADAKMRRRLRRSKLHVMRRCVRVMVGILVLAAFLVYLAFEVDIESVMDNPMLDKNLLQRFFGDNNMPQEEKEKNSQHRSLKIPREHVIEKKTLSVARERQEISQQERNLREWGPIHSP